MFPSAVLLNAEQTVDLIAFCFSPTHSVLMNCRHSSKPLLKGWTSLWPKEITVVWWR